MKTFCIFLLLLSNALLASAQSKTLAYDKEKIYVQTNHVFYAPGETVFFKTYLVKASNNKPSHISSIVYVEVISPSGAVVEKQTYPCENGSSEGSYTLEPQAAGGIYRLKAYTSWMRNEKDSTLFTKSFTVQSIIAPRVLMKLDFDRKGYGAGETVKANFSMRSLDDKPIKYYSGKLSVSIGGHVEKTGTFTTDGSGKAQLAFDLPQHLQTTDGLLNITVDYDSHTESIARSIPITLNKIDLQFMPEGGSFVAGLATNIAFKAINEFGKPVDVKGVIKDSKGQAVASFDSYKFGMGVFPFTPASNERYTAKIENIKEQYPLPQAASEGVVMNISKRDGIIRIDCNSTLGMGVRIIGRTKGTTYYSRDLQIKKGTNEITLNENIFPAGIAQFTLYDNEKSPLAERLVFLNSDKQLHVTLSTDKQRYLPREKVRLTITTRDEKGNPIPSNFSLSVVDDKLWTMADDRQDNILSWLLLSSELRGPIEEPSFYFKKDEPKATLALDLVMQTNGYRYFDFISEVIQSQELKFAPDEGNMVSGVVTNEKGAPIATKVYLVHNTANGKVMQLQTGKDGQFFFSNLVEGGQYVLLAKAGRILLQQTGIGHNPLPGIPLKKLIVEDQFAVAPPPRKEEVRLGFELGNKANHLDEVVVVGYGVSEKRLLTGSVVAVRADELKAIPPGGVMQVLQGRVPGLLITQAANPLEAPLIRIRGANSLPGGNDPLYLVDGVPQERFDLSKLAVGDIDNITIFKDAAAVAIYGSRGANGVIQIQTKKSVSEKLRFKIHRPSKLASQTFRLNGPSFTVARRFYAPVYNSTSTSERNDFRETIYWNPVVQTDRQGKASLEFYNSDATTTFRIIAEGIGYNGKAGRVDTTYIARAAMSIDAKIPPYLTVGDHALIPVVIRNNASRRLEASIDVTLPDNMHAGEFPNTVALEPDSSRRILVPVTATAATRGSIRIDITSDFYNERILLPISAAGKGFPVVSTFSGNANSKHVVPIGTAIAGSLTARLTIYKDLEGQLLNGIESMLQEPHGCFEQTSSTTYPNLFILKYLRQSGKSNPAIERKAMRYIEDGYKRLIGFETAERGFEWFGRTPAHAALTAYGLLEFTDMQEFLQVDKRMLQRTKEFLLGRRDGQGGFKISTHGLDEFASVPDNVANIYIVYALTQAGYGKEVLPEYAAAVKKALESNDAYQLAMMALSADCLKNASDYRLLMDQLRMNYQKYHLSAQTSVVNSRDVSLRVETMALYALALMRSNQPDMGVVAEMISKILAGKSYYGYGSTQGTVLALQAITQYTRLVGEEARKGEIKFVLNGHPVSPDDSLSVFLHPGENSFSVEYPGSGSGIPYNLEVCYNTLTPPTSDKAELILKTSLGNLRPSIGETVRMTVSVTNKKDTLQPMAIAKIGIPAGLSLQPWQLKELIDQKKVAYYEIFDNYLVLYWMGFTPKETKEINLDLKAEVPGRYKAKASNVYLYYTPEVKHWTEGVEAEVVK